MSDSALPRVERRTYLIKRNCSIAQAVPSYAPAGAALWINNGAAGP